MSTAKLTFVIVALLLVTLPLGPSIGDEKVQKCCRETYCQDRCSCSIGDYPVIHGGHLLLGGILVA